MGRVINYGVEMMKSVNKEILLIVYSYFNVKLN